jgi:hypothetical protein
MGWADNVEPYAIMIHCHAARWSKNKSDAVIFRPYSTTLNLLADYIC